MFIYIEVWDYLLTKEPDGRFLVWHHISPEDGGYGTEVEVYLSADYFQKHSVKKFYEFIACKQNCRPVGQSFDKQQQIKTITEKLRRAGWID